MDFKPRIRSQLTTYSPDIKPFFDISQTTVSCEAITDNLSIFNGVQFYIIQNGIISSSMSMYSSSTKITQSYYNISATFQLTSYNIFLYNPNNFYACCTTLNTVSTNNCVQFYLYGMSTVINTNIPITTTVTTTVVTTKPTTTFTTTKSPSSSSSSSATTTKLPTSTQQSATTTSTALNSTYYTVSTTTIINQGPLQQSITFEIYIFSSLSFEYYVFKISHKDN